MTAEEISKLGEAIDNATDASDIAALEYLDVLMSSFESVRELNARMKRLEVLACPTARDRSFFDEKIQEASTLGRN